MPGKLRLKLYVTGRTLRTDRSSANLRRICERELQVEYDLETIDVLTRPQLAEDKRILATPTLVKERPPPTRRVIGDLSNTEKVLAGLDVQSGKGQEEGE